MWTNDQRNLLLHCRSLEEMYTFSFLFLLGCTVSKLVHQGDFSFYMPLGDYYVLAVKCCSMHGDWEEVPFLTNDEISFLSKTLIYCSVTTCWNSCSIDWGVWIPWWPEQNLFATVAENLEITSNSLMLVSKVCSLNTFRIAVNVQFQWHCVL